MTFFLNLILNVVGDSALIFVCTIGIVDSVHAIFIILGNDNLTASRTFCLNNLCTAPCFLEVVWRCNGIPRIENTASFNSKAPLNKFFSSILPRKSLQALIKWMNKKEIWLRSYLLTVMGGQGIEPWTHGLRVRCSASWASHPCVESINRYYYALKRKNARLFEKTQIFG